MSIPAARALPRTLPLGLTTHQARLLALAAVNVILVLLFPPFDSVALGLSPNPSFDAFYFVFARQYNKSVDIGLLSLELAWLALNAALGWSLLGARPAGRALLSARNGVIAAAALNLAIMLLIPPYENYASVLRVTGTYFDGFYLAFGDKWQRQFFIPLLYLEILWLLTNAATLWLLLRPRPAAGPAADATG